MGCGHRESVKQGLIQLLVAGYLLEESKRPQLTAHVLDVLQRNARVMSSPEPKTIKITAVETSRDHKVVCGSGETVVDINYNFVL